MMIMVAMITDKKLLTAEQYSDVSRRGFFHAVYNKLPEKLAWLKFELWQLSMTGCSALPS